MLGMLWDIPMVLDASIGAASLLLSASAGVIPSSLAIVLPTSFLRYRGVSNNFVGRARVTGKPNLDTFFLCLLALLEMV